MGYVQCCGSNHKSISYTLVPPNGFVLSEMDYLEECPICGHTVLLLKRIDIENRLSIFRKTNKKARELFSKLKNSILFVGKNNLKAEGHGSRFYLNYNEFGIKKRCYSNLSTLKLGKFDNSEITEKTKQYIQLS